MLTVEFEKPPMSVRSAPPAPGPGCNVLVAPPVWMVSDLLEPVTFSTTVPEERSTRPPKLALFTPFSPSSGVKMAVTPVPAPVGFVTAEKFMWSVPEASIRVSVPHPSL